MELELSVSYFIFIPNGIPLITDCTFQPHVLSRCFSSCVELQLLCFFPPPSYKMCRHASRQVRAVVTCRRHQYGNKRSSCELFRGYMGFYCYLPSAAAVLLIGRLPRRGHGGGNGMMLLSLPSDSAHYFWSRDPVPGSSEARLPRRRRSRVLGVLFQKHNGPLLPGRVASRLPGQKSTHLSVCFNGICACIKIAS